MKLTVDIPDDVYERVKSTKTLETTDYDIVSLYRAIKNGSPVSMDGDLISRSALKEYAQKLLVGESINTYFGINLYKMFEEIIDNAPTVSERPHGEWIKKVDKVGFISHICSECGAEIKVENPCDDKFCFNCGADMLKGGAE